MGRTYSWAHERKLRLREEDFDPSKVEPYRSRKNPKYCKRLKGAHEFKFFKKEYFKWIKEWIIEEHCTGCGKYKIWFEKGRIERNRHRTSFEN